ncbi:MAG: bifunctional diguanylate cyclase/phosphodiesterase [Pseudomonadota bacterium]
MENDQDANTGRLRQYVLYSLAAQVVLSMSLLALALLGDRSVQVAHDFAKLAVEQRLAFVNTSRASHLLMEEVQSDRPNPRMIERLQTRLQQHAQDFASLTGRVEAAARGRADPILGMISGPSASYERTLSDLRRFQMDLQALSTVPFERLLFAKSYADRIDIAMSPVGLLGQGIRQIGTDMQRQADMVTQSTKRLRIVLVMAMTGVLVALGLLLILPALRDLGAAIARERTLRRNLEEMARRDQMTGLFNRLGLEQSVERLRAGAPYAYAIVDLNNFKPINDTFGHAAGDAVLIETAQRLTLAVDTHVEVARVGGDEFAVLDPQAASLEDCKDLGALLRAAFEDPFVFQDRSFFVSACIGIAYAPQSGGNFDAVATAADAAMYELKGTDVAQFALYTPSLAAGVPNLDRKAALEQAMRNGNLHAWYQPKFVLTSQQLCGFEALARWQNKERGLLSPGDFLDEIERYQLMLGLTITMMRQCLLQLQAWRKAGLNPYPVAVNVSPELLASEQAAEEILWLLAEHKDVRNLLTLELTEEVFVGRNTEAVRRSITRIIDMGVRISIDDFGSGYASFRHLNEFPLHELKIDRSFVRDIASGGSAIVILDAFMSIARGLDIDVVAEGIETQEQRDFLISLGCKIGQGFLFSSALSPHDATQYLAHRKLTA